MALLPKKNFSGIDISEIRKMNALAKADTINLGIGQLPNNLPTEVKNRGIDGFNNGITRYTSNQGMVELREEIAKYHSKKTGKEISPDQVVITNGAEGALWNILYTYLEPDDEVLIPEIAFSVYETIPKLQGAKCVRYNLHNVETKITDKTKFIIINSPCNPTGEIISIKDLQNLCDLAQKYDFYIISDEIYSELYFDGLEPASAYTYSDRVIIVDGISKRAAATGLRIGWTVSLESITKPMVVANQYIATCAPSISQYAAISSLNGESDNFLKEIREDLQEKRDYAYSILSSIPGVEVSKSRGSFYIFPNISKFGDSRLIAKRILDEENVLTIPGIAFGPQGDSYIRISFAVEMNKLKEALEKIASLLNNWSKYES
ncbi:MAG: pyridoxal phosphate-dependent aminotransferase [Spirochaetales bacterium]|nr:pyridoxal phosphate-dependent aminotransferase [Spirochaetales bacterium]